MRIKMRKRMYEYEDKGEYEGKDDDEERDVQG